MNGDASTVEQLVTYGVPGLIALLGVALGKFWERRSGTTSWRRDRRLAAYTELLTGLNDLRQHSVRLAVLEDAEAFRYELALARDTARRLGFVAGQVALLGPGRAEQAAKKAVEAFRALVHELEDWKPPPRHGEDDGEARKLIDAAAKAERVFQRAAQAALK